MRFDYTQVNRPAGVKDPYGPKLWACVTPERQDKTAMIMRALTEGWRAHSRIVIGEPPDDNDAFAVWGQEWLTMRIVPQAYANRRPFFHVDNGYIMPAKGRSTGYYRITYRQMSPVLLNNTDRYRGSFGMPMAPWRKTGTHVLLALPGVTFGRALGLRCEQWIATAEDEIRKHTDRPIVIRPKLDRTPLARHLQDCWALVTHSSNVAIDAVRAGIPVFVAPTSPCAPVGNLDLANLENPAMPGREHWWRSLMCQQFTIDEMRTGVAYDYLMLLREQVDGQQVR